MHGNLPLPGPVRMLLSHVPRGVVGLPRGDRTASRGNAAVSFGGGAVPRGNVSAPIAAWRLDCWQYQFPVICAQSVVRTQHVNRKRPCRVLVPPVSSAPVALFPRGVDVVGCSYSVAGFVCWDCRPVCRIWVMWQHVGDVVTRGDLVSLDD